MTTSAFRLYVLRLTGVLAQGALLCAGTVLFAFGLLDLFGVLALVALIVAWVLVLPASIRARALAEYAEYNLGAHIDGNGNTRERRPGDVGVTRTQYARLRATRVRKHARKALSIPGDRFDLTAALLTTVVWASYLVFLSSVAVASA